MKLFFTSIILVISSLVSNEFFWGVAISEYQNSGAETVDNCNWAEWEKNTGKYSGKSNNHYEDYETHIDALEELGCNAFWFSLEWSMIEPEEGVFDRQVIQRYREEIQELLHRGITPMVTMHHFTEPLWFREKGGFEKEQNIAYFEEFAERIYIEFKDDVKYWAIINEPAVAAFMPYHVGLWPHQKVNIKKGFIVIKNLLQAHVNVYDICKKIDSRPQIGFVHSFLQFHPYSSYHTLERGVAYYMTKNWNESLIGFFLDGNLALDIPFKGDLYYDDPRAMSSYDFVGVNYYSTPILKMTPFGKEWFEATCYEGGIMTDMPYHIDPEGFYKTLMRCRAFNKPIFVTENGIADAKDDRRANFIHEYVQAMLQAKEDGCDIRGYFYWTLFDNFEWSDGYEMKFGLFDIDKKTHQFRIKKGGVAYKEIIKTKVVR